MSVSRASALSLLVVLPRVSASPIGGCLSNYWFGGRRKPLVFLGMAVLSGSAYVLSLGVNLTLAFVLLAILGLMILLPDILLAAYPSDILSRKLAATGMGFLTTFTSTAGIITNEVSGKVADLVGIWEVVFFSFGTVALLGAILTLFIDEKRHIKR